MKRTAVRLALAASALVSISAAAGSVWLRDRLAPVEPESEVTTLFQVEPGASLGGVARALEGRGLVRDARAAVLLARWRSWEGRLQAGEYELSPGMTTGEVLHRISSGRVRTYPVVLPEGVRASEIAQRLEDAGLVDAADFLEAVSSRRVAESLGIDADGLEGYLYPETYRLPRGLSGEAVARILVEQFLEVWRQIEPEARGTGLSRHQIVTLASIVEKETAVPAERPLIAAVFLNRMKRGMRLETDPTVIYGIADFDGNLTKRHLQDAANRYNTYQIAGLPPGPIASPGADALRAVVHPAESDYLYFVSKNDGTHHFSRTYREHVNAVNRFQKSRQARRGSR